MPNPRPLLALLALAGSLTWVGAQDAPPVAQDATPGPAATATSSQDRLFLSFAEDATIIDDQWWEGQIEFSDADNFDTTLVRGVVAVRPWPRVEIGGRVGFGSSDTSSTIPDGEGATDLDIWGKYHLGVYRDEWEFAAGGILTVPTGDDTAGLGDDAFAVAGFGSLRYRLTKAVIVANVGLRSTEDGQIFGFDQDGQTSLFGGAGVILPLSDPVNLVIEVRGEGERFDGRDADSRVLGGINWRATQRGTVRGAVTFGLSDGAPDAQLLVGYAARF